jgi:hypothetical protein
LKRSINTYKKIIFFTVTIAVAAIVRSS